MTTLEESISSCGILYSQGLSEDPRRVIEDWLYSEEDCAFIVFSDNNRVAPGSRKLPLGEILYNFIRKNKLGSITRTASGRNPNSGNDIRVYVYRVDIKAMRDFLLRGL